MSHGQDDASMWRDKIEALMSFSQSNGDDDNENKTPAMRYYGPERTLVAMVLLTRVEYPTGLYNTHSSTMRPWLETVFRRGHDNSAFLPLASRVAMQVQSDFTIEDAQSLVHPIMTLFTQRSSSSTCLSMIDVELVSVLTSLLLVAAPAPPSSSSSSSTTTTTRTISQRQGELWTHGVPLAIVSRLIQNNSPQQNSTSFKEPASSPQENDPNYKVMMDILAATIARSRTEPISTDNILKAYHQAMVYFFFVHVTTTDGRISARAWMQLVKSLQSPKQEIEPPQEPSSDEEKMELHRLALLYVQHSIRSARVEHGNESNLLLGDVFFVSNHDESVSRIREQEECLEQVSPFIVAGVIESGSCDDSSCQSRDLGNMDAPLSRWEYCFLIDVELVSVLTSLLLVAAPAPPSSSSSTTTTTTISQRQGELWTHGVPLAIVSRLIQNNSPQQNSTSFKEPASSPQENDPNYKVMMDILAATIARSRTEPISTDNILKAYHQAMVYFFFVHVTTTDGRISARAWMQLVKSLQSPKQEIEPPQEPSSDEEKMELHRLALLYVQHSIRSARVEHGNESNLLLGDVFFVSNHDESVSRIREQEECLEQVSHLLLQGLSNPDHATIRLASLETLAIWMHHCPDGSIASSIIDTRKASPQKEDSLGRYGTLCALLRLTVGEFRLALSHLVDDDDDDDGDCGGGEGSSNNTSEQHLWQSCGTIVLGMLQIMVSLADSDDEGHDDNGNGTKESWNVDALLHVRHSLEDALHAAVQYLNQPIPSVPPKQRGAAVVCARILGGYVSEIDPTLLAKSSGVTISDLWNSLTISLTLVSQDKKESHEIQTDASSETYEEHDELLLSMLPGICAVLECDGSTEESSQHDLPQPSTLLEMLQKTLLPFLTRMRKACRNDKEGIHVSDVMLWSCRALEDWCTFQLGNSKQADDKLATGLSREVCLWIEMVSQQQQHQQQRAAGSSTYQLKPEHLGPMIHCWYSLQGITSSTGEEATPRDMAVIATAMQFCPETDPLDE
eukprot:CAMPEP_0198304038 /NCGR_PEP_ID=MMETSP1449-20131203/57194_1 /TAXON_ID=420275 /ORGANISM="Attheya septentrionalis, Strain CCMP2084" /LENGTH=1016 /DNA_ID=CAMNT_0044006549 /DNA_START=148 /DNA_END=3197 /DNA_ORIENTATION=-